LAGEVLSVNLRTTS